jgi:AraC-like DNA-binding protein
VLTAELLGRTDGLTISAVTCTEHRDAWSASEVQPDVRLVLVRHGGFRRRADGVDTVVDPTLAYLGVPGEDERFAHPAGGDRCTALSIAPRLWHRLAGERPRLVRSGVYVDARLDLAHRRVLAAAHGGDISFALVEELLSLVARALVQVVAGPTPATPGPDAARAALVADAREAIAAGHPAAGALLPLAGLLGVSPYRLSRAFTRELGTSLTRYRNRVRVGRAVQRLEDGVESLADLAADLGFADQAHLTRTVRAHLGCTPAALRRLLRAVPEPAPER